MYNIMQFHSFLWVLNPPNIEDNIYIYKKILDSVLFEDIPTETGDPFLFELAQTYN